MTRTSVVTGAASGIGKATKELLESRGERVIGVDIHDADIIVDLTTATAARGWSTRSGRPAQASSTPSTRSPALPCQSRRPSP